MNQVEARRYRVLEVLGEGGFGKVYRARLEGSQGFSKDVAIKLLRKDEAPEDALMRFRDEARILGLVRDRAIVTVDPPTLLDGRWAVVMELVEGASVGALLRKGPLPAGVAAEIVGEVARALDKVYTLAGPDGAPLRLIHRDLKPANVQITATGEVKILDFGVARAEFSSRESKTTQHIGGTPGYIAPERLEGEETAAGDVFSAGVVLHEVVTGERPSARHRATYPTDHPARPILDLAEQMRSPEPSARPTWREIERRCRELRATLPPPYLRDWAEERVPGLAAAPGDDLVGSTLTETLSGVPRMPEKLPDEKPRKKTRWWIPALAAVAGLAVLAGLFVLLASVGAIAVFVPRGSSTAPAAATAASAPVSMPPVPVPAPAPAPDPSAAGGTPGSTGQPASGAASGTLAATGKPASAAATGTVAATGTSKADGGRRKADGASASASAPAPPATAPAPTATPATWPVSFTSIPMGATVYVDDVAIGEAPLLDQPVTAGHHRVRMELDGQGSIYEIDIGKRQPTRYIWRSKEDRWDAGY